MTTFSSTSRKFLLAGAFALAALPALAGTVTPAVTPAAPAASAAATATPGKSTAVETGKTATGKKVAHAKVKHGVHKAAVKKPADGMSKPATPAAGGSDVKKPQ